MIERRGDRRRGPRRKWDRWLLIIRQITRTGVLSLIATVFGIVLSGMTAYEKYIDTEITARVERTRRLDTEQEIKRLREELNLLKERLQ